MSLQTRLANLVTAVGTDIKTLYGRTNPAGGSTGQVLTKSSGTDYATTWASPIRAMLGNTPPSGGYWLPWHMVSSGASTTVALNTVYFTPFAIEGSYSIQSMGIMLTALAAGGAGLAFTVGLYADKGDGTGPLLAGGPLVQGAIDITAASATTPRSLAVSLALTPGLYWAASRYTYTTVPTTPPTFSCISNSTSLWRGSAQDLSISRYLSLASASALPTTEVTLTPAGFSTCPLIGLQRA